MDSEATRRYFFFGLLIVGLLFAIFLLWPFLKVIILAMVLSVVLYPVYSFFLRRVSRGNKWVASFLTILVFLIVICVPLFFISKSVIHQTQDILTFLTTPGKTASIVDGFNNFIKTHFSWVPVDLDSYATNFAQRTAASLGSIISVVLSTLLSLLLLILTLFYFLKDGGEWNSTLVSLSPLSKQSTQKIFNKLKAAMNGVMKGYLLVAIAQGTLMGIGLWIFGVPNPALWGVLTGLASLVPTIGTALVSIPSAIYLFVSGHVGAGIGFVIWATCAVGLVDNLLNPFIVGRSVEIHPMLILFSVLGGVALMGPIGIVLGPLAISFVFAVMSVYSSEIRHEETPA
jgi:predicted PurR-regulated permease PerM